MYKHQGRRTKASHMARYRDQNRIYQATDIFQIMPNEINISFWLADHVRGILNSNRSSKKHILQKLDYLTTIINGLQ
jgi:hypothetical protein